MTFVPFNLNQKIKVRINDAGYKHLAKLHNKLVGVIPKWDRRGAAHYKKQADAEGYTTMQGWEFMQMFEGYFGLGLSVLFDINILFEQP